jgi:eukaryotic-like serine/threonine-protein kinase
MDRYPPAVLRSVFPRFANFKLLGQGGEGAVFAVWDRFRHEELALKLTRNAGDADLEERFEHEYTILRSSRSDHLVRVYDHGVVPVPLAGGSAPSHYWYTMELCEGSVRSSYRRMPLGRRVGIALQMLDGLAFLHAKSIAHRDIKPDNLFLVKDRIKIGDFGLARTVQTAAGPMGTASMFMGSPPYLAPERWTDAPSSDWRPSDQYAAGVTVYELLSAGRAPLDFGQTPESRRRAHLWGAVYPLGIPEIRTRGLESLDAVIGRMLAKEPEARYADIAECKRELAAALVQEDVEGRVIRGGT